jgi:hypothetical protein
MRARAPMKIARSTFGRLVAAAQAVRSVARMQ